MNNQMDRVKELTANELEVLSILSSLNGQAVSVSGLLVLLDRSIDFDVSMLLFQLCAKGFVSSKKITDHESGDRQLFFMSSKVKKDLTPYLQELAANKVAPTLYQKSGFTPIFDALIDKSPEKLTFEQIHALSKVTATQLRWRLSVMLRENAICAQPAPPPRRKKMIYFLNKEQEAHLRFERQVKESGGVVKEIDSREILGAISIAKGELAAAEKERIEQLKRLSFLERSAEKEREVIEKIKKEREKKERELTLLKATSHKDHESFSRLIASAQHNPIALSERLSFIKELRKRPALEPMHTLLQIEMDYQVALKIVREKE